MTGKRRLIPVPAIGSASLVTFRIIATSGIQILMREKLSDRDMPVIAVALAVVAVPIRIYLFGGVTGSGADFLTAYLTKVGQDLFSSVVVTVVTSNLADKIVTALLVWIIVRGLPQRTVGDWPYLSHSRG